MSWIEAVNLKIALLESELDSQQNILSSQRLTIKTIKELILANHESIRPNFTADNLNVIATAHNTNPPSHNAVLSLLNNNNSTSSASKKRPISTVASQTLTQNTPAAKKVTTSASLTSIISSKPSSTPGASTKQVRALKATNEFIRQTAPWDNSTSFIRPESPFISSNTVSAVTKMSKKEVAAHAALQNELQKQLQAEVASRQNAVLAAQPPALFTAPRLNPQIYGDIAVQASISSGVHLGLGLGGGCALGVDGRPLNSVATGATGVIRSGLLASKSPAALSKTPSASKVSSAQSTTVNTAVANPDSSGAAKVPVSLAANPIVPPIFLSKDSAGLLERLCKLATPTSKLEAVNKISRTFDKKQLKILFHDGARVVLYNWLVALEEELDSPDKRAADKLLRVKVDLVAALVKLLNMAEWTEETIAHCRFDKVLRRLYKTFCLLPDDPKCVSLTELLKEVWYRYRSLHKGLVAVVNSASSLGASSSSSSGKVTVKSEVKPVINLVGNANNSTPDVKHGNNSSVSGGNVSTGSGGNVTAAAAAALLRESREASNSSLNTSTHHINSTYKVPALSAANAQISGSHTALSSLLSPAAGNKPITSGTYSTSSGALNISTSSAAKQINSSGVSAASITTQPVPPKTPAALAGTPTAQQLATLLRDPKTDVCSQFRAMETLASDEDKLYIAKLLIGRLRPNHHEAQRFLNSGGRVVLFAWLDPLCNGSEVPSGSQSLTVAMQLVEILVRLLDMVPWTPDQVREHRFDKILRRLYKRFKDHTSSPALVALLKETWSKFRVLFVEKEGADDAQSTASGGGVRGGASVLV